MTVGRRILANAAAFGSLEAGTQVANLVIVVLLTRRYGLESLGSYAFAMALGSTLATFVGLGATGFAMRELAREPARARWLLAALGPPQYLLAALLLTAAVAWAEVMQPDQGAATAVMAILCAQCLERFTNFQLAPQMAAERFGRVALLGLAERTLALLAFATLAERGASFAAACLAFPLTSLAALGIAAGWTRRTTPPAAARPATGERIAAVRAALPFLWSVAITTLYQRGGLLVLTAAGGAAAAGTFAAGERLLVPCAMLYGTFATAALPALARLSGDAARLRDLATRCLRLVLLATVGLATVTASVAEPLVQRVWGTSPPGAVDVLRVLAAATALRAMTSLLSVIGQALGAERDVARLRGVALLGFAVLSTPASAHFGALGLAGASGITDLALVLGMLSSLRRTRGLHLAVGGVLRLFAAAALVLPVCAALPAQPLPTAALIAAGVFTAAMFASGCVRPGDVTALGVLLRDRRAA